MPNIFRYLIIGAPGSGKGTISSKIIKYFNCDYISSGDKLRLHVRNGTELGLEAKKFIDSGRLVPDSLMINFIIDEINKVKNNNWLLDGFPRNISQAEQLWAIQKFDMVLNLDVPFSIIIDRIKSRWIHVPSGRVYNTNFNAPKVLWKDDITGEDLVQREDDKPNIIAQRLEDYKNLTTPLLKFYNDMGILHTFRGNTSNEIWPKVLDCLTIR